MNDYSDMKNKDFDCILCEIVGNTSAGSLLQIPGIYEILSEHFNNEILETWNEEKLLNRGDDD